jgi:RNA polymerase sigma factor (sigma-70 family)
MEVKVTFETKTAQGKNGKQKRLNEVQEKLLIDSYEEVKKVANGFYSNNRHIDKDDLEGYLFEQLTLYVSKFDPEKGDGEAFVKAVLRDKGRNYLDKHVRHYKRFGGKLPSTDEEIEGYEDSCVFVSAEDLEETVIFENDIKGAVKQLFEMANEQEREIMLLLMEGYRVEEIKRRLGFKHRETVRRIIKRLGKKLGYNPLT